MKYRSVGKSGLKISEVALGSWVTDLKGTAAEDVAKETVKLAYDSGVNFFDCADAYSGGAAERFLGKTLKQYPRKELVISSKVYFPTGEGVNDRGLSRKHIFESIDQTLKNMQTDYLDMYFCHRFDETTDLTETLRAMSDLVAQGKVLYYGVSEEWGSARLEEAQRIIDRYNLYPITVVQPQYNLNDRYIEHEIDGHLPQARHRHHHVLPARAGSADRQVPQGPAAAGRLARHLAVRPPDQRSADR